MGTKTFSLVSSISMILSFSTAILSVIGMVITGFYPGILVLVLLAIISISSKWYAIKISGRPPHFQRRYYTVSTIVNFFIIMMVLWVSFVIVRDRIVFDCC